MQSSSRDRSGVVVGLALFGLAGVLMWDASQLNRAVAYGFGPEVMPRVVSAGLVALGVFSVIAGLRSDESRPGRFHVADVATICLGFLALTACIGLGGGFIAAMTLLFVATCWAFGRRAPHVDAALGVALATATYLLFSKLLALSLPAGPLEKLFG
ncbi:MAG: tripartite tricarboxylate transporter TctB family protein [Methylobacteriaceae bacterium]|nr:tripartite tricarboxylate transporter TctB family protein [Methylobacteriaceae bacterium]